MNIILVNPEYEIPEDDFIAVWKLFRFGTKSKDLESYLGVEARFHPDYGCYLLPYEAYARFQALKKSPYRKTIIAAWYAIQDNKK